MKNYLIKKLKTKANHQGFTLIETLVSIAILTTAILGPLFIAFQGVKLSYFARDQVIALYLAQEGIELARLNIIANDNDGKQGSSLIFSGTSYDLSVCSALPTDTATYCYIDGFSNIKTSCPVAGCPYIKYDTVTGKYQYNTGDPTLFKRSIRIRHEGVAGATGDRDFQLESKVEWSHQGDPKEILLKEILVDWRP